MSDRVEQKLIRRTVHEAAWYPGIPEGAKMHIVWFSRTTAWTGSKSVNLITTDPNDPAVISEIYMCLKSTFNASMRIYWGVAAADGRLEMHGGATPTNKIYDYSQRPILITRTTCAYNVNNNGQLLHGYIKYWRKNA
jgi:hypothetical protein